VSQTPRERRASGSLPLYVNEDWERRFPFLVQGTTGRGDDDFDLGLFRDGSVGTTLGRWRQLREATGMPTAVHARQVHGARILRHSALPAGMLIADDADGHVTDVPGILLTISIADCVPILIVAPARRAVAALHAGWRGAAADILEDGIRALTEAGSGVEDLWVHFGPAICGRCYEVGAEVHEALGLPRPDRNTPVDLRAVLSNRAATAGIPGPQISASAWCTRCDETRFFSHRAGNSGRQMGVIGVRPA
jgi:polyphenol oxidase